MDKLCEFLFDKDGLILVLLALAIIIIFVLSLIDSSNACLLSHLCMNNDTFCNSCGVQLRPYCSSCMVSFHPDSFFCDCCGLPLVLVPDSQ